MGREGPEGDIRDDIVSQALQSGSCEFKRLHFKWERNLNRSMSKFSDLHRLFAPVQNSSILVGFVAQKAKANACSETEDHTQSAPIGS